MEIIQVTNSVMRDLKFIPQYKRKMGYQKQEERESPQKASKLLQEGFPM